MSRGKQTVAIGLALVVATGLWLAGCGGGDDNVTVLRADDFRFGTYVIDQPGDYRLGEDISFNPNSPAVLDAALADGSIPAELALQLDLNSPVDAYHAGMPLFLQFSSDPPAPFVPGGPTDPRYDPRGFGLGFFAAIVITADGVDLDLDGHLIEQSAEHALLQRFFAVIELADQPFVPMQGPADFGERIQSAANVIIHDGVIGRSAHHGIHGNGNTHITVRNVDFVDYEVGAVALNGVTGLLVEDVTATNRKDIPVVGTFSSAQFIKPYVEDLMRSGSATTLQVGDDTLTVRDMRQALITAINHVHHDIIVDPYMVDGRAQIDPAAHPDEYALFHNPSGLLDGNSYSFLVNRMGVAVDGFPTVEVSDDHPARDVTFRNVRVIDQRARINETVAIDSEGAALTDPVGAVFQVWNMHPDSGEPVTISAPVPARARYVGNVVANAQALVAKAAAAGEVGSGRLDISRMNFSEAALAWIEGRPGAETLSDAGLSFLCNGDSMFHVNKGVIAFKVDGARNVALENTSVDGLINTGPVGSMLCGDYSGRVSHPKAILPGYGGGAVRAYTFAGTTDVSVVGASVSNVRAAHGSAAAFAVLTDSARIDVRDAVVSSVSAGTNTDGADFGPSVPPAANALYVSAGAVGVQMRDSCASGLTSSGVVELVGGPGVASAQWGEC